MRIEVNRRVDALESMRDERDAARDTLAKMEEMTDDMGRCLGVVLGDGAHRAITTGEAPAESVLGTASRPRRKPQKRSPSVLVGILEKGHPKEVEEELSRREEMQNEVVKAAEEVMNRFAEALTQRMDECDESRKVVEKMEIMSDDMGLCLGAILGDGINNAIETGEQLKDSILDKTRRKTLASTLVGLLEKGDAKKVAQELQNREEMQSEAIRSAEEAVNRFARALTDKMDEREEAHAALAKKEEMVDDLTDCLRSVLDEP